MSKDKPIDIMQNGHKEIPHFTIKAAGRIQQITPDGSNWEIRVHMMADLSKLTIGPEMGEEIIGEVIIRTFNGGIAPLAQMGIEAARTAQQLVAKITVAMNEAEKRLRGGVEVVKDLPPELKNRN